jgi:hypothetical protein
LVGLIWAGVFRSVASVSRSWQKILLGQQPFEVAVFMDGTVELINATITDNGSVCLPAADARRMAEHILALLPAARAE